MATILLSFIGGIMVFLATAALIGFQKTKNLPGGAIAFAVATTMINHETFIIGVGAVVAAIIGHIICVLFTK